ncbi:benzaldehyde dehydrogenase [Streptomyces sp. NPDC006476]|uniref:benzaldehyde dehydrogenase n=1 Tax=Streptomyces sp. NPDC006476 TaxID=3157175 RepID=UPI0033B37C50
MGLLDEASWVGRIKLLEWANGRAGSRAVTEPATGAELGQVGMATPQDVADAVETSARAQPEWARLPYTERAAVLRRAGELFEQTAEEVGDWIVRETGSIPGKAAFETHTAAQECFEAAALASYPYGQLLRSAQPRLSLARHLPVGVVGVISPFNVPIVLAIRAVAPALALGNAVVLKPDPRTAVSGGVVLARIFEEAGLPAGLLTVLPGGADVGEALVTHPRVPVIAFTGSTRGGRAVARAAAEHLKRVHLELGGNSAMIVLDDVDIDRAASVGAWGSFFHQGQVCMATARHLVHESVADAYAEALAARAEKVPVGDPASGTVLMGPVIDTVQRDAIHAAVTETIDAGARLRAGGTYDGLFYRPTVLDAVPLDSPVYATEVFGPVAPVVTFTSLDEAAELALGTEYGLSLGILTRDVTKGLELAERIPTGLVHINDQTINDEAVVPFGGLGASGTGSRHGGHEANLEAFTETQWVTVRGDLPSYPF